MLLVVVSIIAIANGHKEVNTSVVHDSDFEIELRATFSQVQHRTATLVAIVVPICTTKCPADVRRLEASLKRWSDIEYIPCSSAVSMERPLPPDEDTLHRAEVCGMSLLGRPHTYTAHLILYMDNRSAEVERRMTRITQGSGWTNSCFQGVSFLSAGISSTGASQPIDLCIPPFPLSPPP